MVLDGLKDRFVIVARQGNSVQSTARSAEFFAQAIQAGADFIQTDVQMAKNGVLVCTSQDTVNGEKLVGAMDVEDLKKAGVVPLYELIAQVKNTQTHLLLNPKSAGPKLAERIAGDARFFGMEDRIAVVARSIKHTKDIRAQSDKLAIVGVLDNPEHYAAFYKAGGNVATLGKLETTPGNVRLAEAAEGPKRHPFWVLGGDASHQDVFNACNGLVGAKGMIMKDPAVGREALRRRAAPLPACAGCAPD